MLVQSNGACLMYGAKRMNKQKHKAFDGDEKKTKSDSAINMHKW